MESLENFLSRIYYSGPKEIVLVFKSKKAVMDTKTPFAKNKPEKWDLPTFRAYLLWLKNNEKEIVL
jgi:hypothetical protein